MAGIVNKVYCKTSIAKYEKRNLRKSQIRRQLRISYSNTKMEVQWNLSFGTPPFRGHKLDLLPEKYSHNL